MAGAGRPSTMPTIRGNKIVQLSYPLRVGDPFPPAIPPLQITPKYSLDAGDAANVFMVSFANHSGTHVDAPRHVVADGIAITQFAPHEFHFDQPVVVDLPLPDRAVIGPDDLAPHAVTMLLRFGYGPVRANEPERYRDQAPGFGVEGAAYLREQFPDLRAVGMDVPSFSTIAYLKDTMRAHNVVLGEDCVVVVERT